MILPLFSFYEMVMSLDIQKGCDTMKKVRWNQKDLVDIPESLILQGDVVDESDTKYTIVITTEGFYKGQTHIIPKSKAPEFMS